jgi:iron complex outermembrane receptor protein
MIRHWLFTVSVLLCSASLQAQDTCGLSVTIRVTEEHNAAPIPDLMLYFIENKMNVQTDENGEAVINNICPGLYHIHTHSYEIQDTTLALNITKSGLYKLKLSHATQTLNLVEIRDKNERILLQNKEQLNSKMLQANSGKTISEQLKNINGVSTLNNGATISKPIIHGLHSNRILMLNNGIRQEDQQWGSEHAPNIDPFIANQVTVLKGAAGVRYGTDAIGGVVLVEPKAIRTENGWGGELNVAAFSNNRMGVGSAMVEHRFSKMPSLAFRLQASVKQAGNYQIPGGVWVANTGVKENNFSGTLVYTKAHSGAEVFFSRFNNTLGIYRGSHTGSQKDLNNAINSSKPLVAAGFTYAIDRPRQVVSHHLLKVKAYLDNQWGLWNAVYAYQNNYRQEYDVLRVDNGKAQLNLRLNTHSLNLNLQHKKLKHFTGQVGIDGQFQHNTFKDGDRVFIPSYYGYSVAAYAIERYSKNNWTLEAGARFDYKHFDMYNPEGAQFNNMRYLFDYKNPSATLAVKKRSNQNWEWTATLANAWRAPQSPELFSAGFHQGGARMEYGNKNLQPERSYSLTLGSHVAPTKKWTIDASIYVQSIQDFIYLKPGADLLTIRGYYKTFNYVQTNALLSGMDISSSYNWNKRWRSEAKVSFLRARDRSQKDWLILMPSDRLSIGTKYTFDLGEHLKEGYLGLDAQYVSQQKRVPNNFDQIDYPRPPAAYYLVHAEIGASIYWGKQMVDCSISASNLLNAKYRDYMDIFRYFVDQPGRNIALRIRLPIH